MKLVGASKCTLLALAPAILFLYLFSPFLYSVHAFGSSASIPNIQNVTQTPIEPPPDIAVNVVSVVIDSNGVANVSLIYSVNWGSSLPVTMIVIEGDNYNGTFLASIPGQAVGAYVSYYIYTIDTYGYSTQSTIQNYTVTEDTKEPWFAGIHTVYPQPGPITPWDVVKIRADITDDGSGIADATLFHGLREPSNETVTALFSKVSMDLTNGDKYDGTYEGEIPPQENGTIVWYYIEAWDGVGNKRISDYSAYEVYFNNASYFGVIVQIAEIDTKDLSARLDVFFSARLPSQFEQESLLVEAYNARRNNTAANFDIFSINSSTTERFYYQGKESWKVSLLGIPNRFPYDYYTLELTFQVYWSRIDRLQIEKPFFTDPRLRFVWEEPMVLARGNNTSDYPEVFVNFQLTRNADDRFPVTLPILALFFMLGATLSVDSKTHLRNRLTVYLTSFVFIVGFFYTLGSWVPIRFSFTVAELMVITLTLGTVALVVSSFISASLSLHPYRILINTCSDSVAVLFIFYLFLDRFRVGYMQTPLLFSISTADLILIVIGVVYGLAIRAYINRKELKLQLTRVCYSLWNQYGRMHIK